MVGRPCKTEGCTNETATPARHYCEECREIRKAPNVLRRGDLIGSKLFFGVAGTRHHPASAQVVQGERLYFVRDPENPYDSNAIEVRRANGDLIGFVPKDGVIHSRYAHEPFTLRDFAQCLDAGARSEAFAYAVGGRVQIEGHAYSWLRPHPARLEVWAQRGGSGLNLMADPLPFTVTRERRPAPPADATPAPVVLPAACEVAATAPRDQQRSITLLALVVAGGLLIALGALYAARIAG
jgi:hypothetical protein